MAKGAEDWVREAREVKDAMREHSPAVSQWATEGKGESPPPAARPLLHISLSLSLSLSRPLFRSGTHLRLRLTDACVLLVVPGSRGARGVLREEAGPLHQGPARVSLGRKGMAKPNLPKRPADPRHSATLVLAFSPTPLPFSSPPTDHGRNEARSSSRFPQRSSLAESSGTPLSE